MLLQDKLPAAHRRALRQGCRRYYGGRRMSAQPSERQHRTDSAGHTWHKRLFHGSLKRPSFNFARLSPPLASLAEEITALEAIEEPVYHRGRSGRLWRFIMTLTG